MKIAIIGAGAIGSVTGALLSDKGHDVVLIGRDDQVSAINKGGLLVQGAVGSKRYNLPAKVSLDFAPDMAILAVKTQDVESTCLAMRPHVKDALIVTMQNGVKADEIAVGVLGRDNMVSAVVMYGATYLEPGNISYNFPGGLVIGLAFPGAKGEGDALLEKAHDVLSGAFDLHVSKDIHGTHWTKLILNLNNALSGVLGIPLQEVFDDPRLCTLGVALMREAHEVMESAGISLMPLPDLPVERLKELLGAPPEVSAGIYGNIMRGLSKDPLPGSVLQSIQRGKPSEVDYLNGEIAVLGMLHRNPTPLNYKITKMVKEVEKHGRFVNKEELLEAFKGDM